MPSSPKLGVSFATWVGGLQMIAPCQVGLLETLYACMLCCLSKHLGFAQSGKLLWAVVVAHHIFDLK